jgi:ParB-like chromosome segregation protein Spo0J
MTALKNNVGDLVYLPRMQLEAYQGEFKKEKPDLIDKLAEEIKNHGFNAPVFIWANHPSKKPALLDGHQRLKALEKLASKGLYLPDDKLPVVSIFAKDDAEAWQKIIEYNSQYSEINNSVMIEMIGTYSLDMINIPIELTTSDLEKEMIDKYTD